MADRDQRQPIVLMAIDDAAAAATALPVGRTLARQLGASLVALYVSPASISIDQARRKLGLDASGAEDVSMSVRVGDPDAEILAAAHEGDARLLIIVARLGDSTEAMGSVALSVVNGSRIPIVLVRPAGANAHEIELRPLQRLLLPLDGSPTTARALRSATLLAEELRAHLDLLYVAGGAAREAERGSIAAPRYIDQAHHEWPSWAAEVVDRLCRCLARCPESVPVDMHLVTGDPGAEVPLFASHHDEDAMVLVRRSPLGLGRARTLLRTFARSTVRVSIVVTPFRRDALTPPRAAAAMEMPRIRRSIRVSE